MDEPLFPQSTPPFKPNNTPPQSPQQANPVVPQTADPSAQRNYLPPSQTQMPLQPRVNPYPSNSGNTALPPASWPQNPPINTHQPIQPPPAQSFYKNGPSAYNQNFIPMQGPSFYTPPHGNYFPPLTAAQAQKKLRKQFRSSCNQIGWTMLSGLLLLTGFISVFTAIVQILHLYPAGMSYSELTKSATFFFMQSISYILAFFIPTILLLLLKRIPVSEAFPSQRVPVSVAISTVIIGFSVCIWANFPSTWIMQFFQRFGLSEEVPAYEVNQDPLAQILFFIGVAVIPPLVEEFLFRGAILRLLRRGGDGFAIIFSSILFALFHGNLIQVVFAFICGLALAYTVIRTGNIWLAIIIHFLNNSWSVIYQILYTSGFETASWIFYSICIFLIPILGIGAIIFLALKRKLLPESFSKSPLSMPNRLNAFFFNPGILVFLAYSIFSCVLMLFYTTA